MSKYILPFSSNIGHLPLLNTFLPPSQYEGFTHLPLEPEREMAWVSGHPCGSPPIFLRRHQILLTTLSPTFLEFSQVFP